jgi:chromosome partitioning protein
MILVVGGIKGGSGKTMLATHLAVYRAAVGPTLLMDADEQASATDFTRQRHHRLGAAGYQSVQAESQGVLTRAQELAPAYQTLVIDAGGRDTKSQRAAMVAADVMLIPFTPTSADLWTAELLAPLIAEARQVNPRLRVVTVLNRLFPRGADNVAAAEALQGYAGTWQYLDTPIGTRKVFSNAFGGGLTVEEYPQKDRKAITEMRALYATLFA